MVNGEAYAKLQGMIKKKRGVERKARGSDSLFFHLFLCKGMH